MEDGWGMDGWKAWMDGMDARLRGWIHVWYVGWFFGWECLGEGWPQSRVMQGMQAMRETQGPPKVPARQAVQPGCNQRRRREGSTAATVSRKATPIGMRPFGRHSMARPDLHADATQPATGNLARHAPIHPPAHPFQGPAAFHQFSHPCSTPAWTTSRATHLLHHSYQCPPWMPMMRGLRTPKSARFLTLRRQATKIANHRLNPSPHIMAGAARSSLGLLTVGGVARTARYLKVRPSARRTTLRWPHVRCLPTYLPTCLPACIHTYIHTCVYPHMHACIRTHTSNYMKLQYST